MNETLTSQATWIEMEKMDLPEYARTHSPEALESLAGDLKRNGQLQNIVVSKEGDRYEVVAGVGRAQATKLLGWDKIRADVREGLTKGQKLAMTVSENNEREDASPLYTAQLYKMLMTAEGLDQTGLAERLGKDKGLISKYLSLTDLVPEAQEKLKRFNFGIGIGLELIKLSKPDDQIKLANECAEKDYSVRELQKRVRKLLNPVEGNSEPTKTTKPEGAFQIARRGKGFLIHTQDAPTREYLDIYMQNLRGAIINFLAQESTESSQKAA